jgi:hypothetical protein
MTKGFLFIYDLSMRMNVANYALRVKYDQLKSFGDKLADLKGIIDWGKLDLY